jgi:hypothetical protein
MVMGITPARRDDDFRNELAHLNLPSCERRTWFWTLKESFDLFLEWRYHMETGQRIYGHVAQAFVGKLRRS